MPNANIGIYLTDDNYFIYKDHKKEINNKIREALKSEVKRLSKCK